MSKTKIYVAKAFKLLGADGVHTNFPVGMHTVDQDVADNWYVKHHLGDPGDVLAAPSGGEMTAALAAARAELEAEGARLAERQAELAAEGRRLTELRADLDAMSKGIDARAADLDSREGSIAARELEHASNVAAFEAARADAASQKASGSQKQAGKQA